MKYFIILLRGINVGGNNMIKMTDLKASFERRGFRDVTTYINSGNILFSTNLDETNIKIISEKLITDDFGLDIPVCIISDRDLIDAVAHAPDWWNKDSASKHNAIFIIPPITTEEVCLHVGEIREKYEKASCHGRVVFWSAPIATFSRTRWSKISQDRAMYRAITVRNANTVLKLAGLAGKQVCV